MQRGNRARKTPSGDKPAAATDAAAPTHGTITAKKQGKRMGMLARCARVRGADV